MENPTVIFALVKNIWYINYRKNLSKKDKQYIINECFKDAEYDIIQNFCFSYIYIDNAQKNLYFNKLVRLKLHNKIIEKLYPIN